MLVKQLANSFDMTLTPTSFDLVINRLDQRRLVRLKLFLHFLDALACHLETEHFLLQGLHLGNMVVDYSAIDHIIVPGYKFLGIDGREHLFQCRYTSSVQFAFHRFQGME